MTFSDVCRTFRLFSPTLLPVGDSVNISTLAILLEGGKKIYIYILNVASRLLGLSRYSVRELSGVALAQGLAHLPVWKQGLVGSS